MYSWREYVSVSLRRSDQNGWVMRRQLIVALAIPLVVVSGCAQRGISEGTTAWRLEDCRTLDAHERDACEADARRSYDEYQDQREQALKDTKS